MGLVKDVSLMYAHGFFYFLGGEVGEENCWCCFFNPEELLLLICTIEALVSHLLI